MIINTSFFLLAVMIPSLLLTINFMLSSRSSKDREKSSPFECGFDPKSTARIPFSTRFFLLAIIFLIFDIEIVLLTPLPMCIMNINLTSTLITSLLFSIILFIGLVHEWKEGSLEWSN